MGKSITAGVKTEGNVVEITDFAKNVGIKSISWNEDFNRVVIEYYNDKDQTIRESLYDKDFATINFKSPESKAKAVQYQINAFAGLCQTVDPDITLIDTTSLQEAFGEYVSQIADKLPSPPVGQLKLTFSKDLSGQYYNFKVSRNLPTYTIETDPEKIKKKLWFNDDDKKFLVFTKVEVTPDAEPSTETAPETLTTPLPF